MEPKTLYRRSDGGALNQPAFGEPLPAPAREEVLHYIVMLLQGRLVEIFDHIVEHYGITVCVDLPDYSILHLLAQQLTGLPLKPYVIVAGPQANQFVMSGDYHAVQRRPIEVRGFPLDEEGAVKDRCIVALDGPMQKYYRRFLFEPFHHSCLAHYIPLIERCVSYRLQAWDGQINLFSQMERLAVEICAHTMLGIELEQGALAEFSAAYWPITLGSRKREGKRAKLRMRELLTRLIQQRTERPGHDALSVLIQSMQARYPDITQDDLIHYGFMLVEVGQSDMAIFLTYVVSALALYPELSERLLAELTVYSPESLLDVEKTLPLTTSVLREVERLYPPVPYIFRYAAQDMRFGAYHIPADSWLISAVSTTHRLPGLFHDPTRFDPDRFLPPRNESTSRFAVMGFGAGAHGCIGMKFVRVMACVVVYLLLQQYRLRLTDTDELPKIDYRGRCQKPGRKITLAVANR